MIGHIEITFTYAQYQAVRHWATDRHRSYLDKAVVTPKRRKVTMPVQGWVTLAAILERQVFDKWGRAKRLGTSDAVGTKSALTAIARAITKLAGHPAFRGEIVIGYSADEFLAWSDPSGAWRPWPVLGRQSVLLLPRFEPAPVVTAGAHQMRFKEGITYWVVAGPPGDHSECLGWSLDEDEATGT